MLKSLINISCFWCVSDGPVASSNHQCRILVATSIDICATQLEYITQVKNLGACCCVYDGADVWPLTAPLTKSLDAAYHRWQRSILGISWKDRITNVEVRTRTGQQTMDNIQRKTTSLAWTCLPYGPQAHTIASTVLAGTRIQERTRSTKSELEGHSQQRPTKDGVHLGGSRGGSS